jgi:hypothetical protein
MGGGQSKALEPNGSRKSSVNSSTMGTFFISHRVDERVSLNMRDHKGLIIMLLL